VSTGPPERVTVGTVLFAAGAGWTGGNVGPAVTQISRAFDVSLSTVGLLMTVFFAAVAVVTVFAPPLANRIQQ
jgi:cyanate permease